MDAFQHEPPRSSNRRLRWMAAAALLVVVVAIALFVVTGAWSEFLQGFNQGLHPAPAAPTTTH